MFPRSPSDSLRLLSPSLTFCCHRQKTSAAPESTDQLSCQSPQPNLQEVLFVMGGRSLDDSDDDSDEDEDRDPRLHRMLLKNCSFYNTKTSTDTLTTADGNVSFLVEPSIRHMFTWKRVFFFSSNETLFCLFQVRLKQFGLPGDVCCSFKC